MANDIATKADLYYPGAGNASSDFIGFSFNGITHTDMGISRVSEGSRYSEQMLPNFQDKSAQMPGSDYTLYWESFYSTKTWTLQIAFDDMLDRQMRLLRQTLNTKNLSNLTFDERPGIHWLAKVQSVPQLKYICFDTDEYRVWDNSKPFILGYSYYVWSSSANNNQGGYVLTQNTSPQQGTTYYEHITRIYKGEGTITFISYYPFGMSDLQTKTNIASSVITNNGDIPMDWYVVLSTAQAKQLEQLKVETTAASGGATLSAKIITFNQSGLNSNVVDDYVVISSKTNLIEGADSYNAITGAYNATGRVYNQYISSGDFFQIPVSETGKTLTFYITGPDAATRNLHYRYLYL